MSKTDYSKVDAEILAAVVGKRCPYTCERIKVLAKRLVEGNANKEPFRIVDARLQALRKRGVIEYDQRQWKAVEKAAA